MPLGAANYLLVHEMQFCGHIRWQKHKLGRPKVHQQFYGRSSYLPERELSFSPEQSDDLCHATTVQTVPGYPGFRFCCIFHWQHYDIVEAFALKILSCHLPEA